MRKHIYIYTQTAWEGESWRKPEVPEEKPPTLSLVTSSRDVFGAETRDTRLLADMVPEQQTAADPHTHVRGGLMCLARNASYRCCVHDGGNAVAVV